MPALELEDLLLQSESRLCWLSRVKAAKLARAAKTGVAPDVDTHEAERDAVLADDHVLSRLEHAYNHAAPDTVVHRRSALLLSAALEARLSAESGQRRALRQVSALVDSFRGPVGRERLALDGLRLTLRRDPSRARREQAWNTLAQLARLVEPFQRESLAGLAGSWAPRRGPEPVSFWDQPLSPFRVEWGHVDLPCIATRFLEETQYLVDRQLHHVARVLRVRSPRAYDLDFGRQALSQRYEARFAPADAAPSIARGMRACGLPIDTLPLDPLVDPKWLPLSHAGWPPVDWATYPIPGEGADDETPLVARARVRPRVILVADFRGGSQSGWVELASSTGAGLSVLFGRGGFLAERRSLPGLDPAALIVASLLSEPNWLAGQTAMPRSEMSGYLALGCLRSGVLHGMRSRVLAAMALASWRVLSDPQIDPAQAVIEALAGATGIDDAGRLWPLDFAVSSHPAYWASLFLNEVAVSQVARYLRREHGRIMGDRRTGEVLVECFWRHGALVTLADAVQSATGEPLGEGSLVIELRETTSV